MVLCWEPKFLKYINNIQCKKENYKHFFFTLKQLKKKENRAKKAQQKINSFMFEGLFFPKV